VSTQEQGEDRLAAATLDPHAANDAFVPPVLALDQHTGIDALDDLRRRVLAE